MYRVKGPFCLPSLNHFLFTATYYMFPFFSANFDFFLSTNVKYFLFTSADYKLPFVMDNVDIFAFPTHLQRLHLSYTSFVNYHGENLSNEPPR